MPKHLIIHDGNQLFSQSNTVQDAHAFVSSATPAVLPSQIESALGFSEMLAKNKPACSHAPSVGTSTKSRAKKTNFP